MTKRSAVRTCTVDGCDVKHHAKGYCQRHYNKWFIYNDPLGGHSSRIDVTAQEEKKRIEAAREVMKGRLSKEQPKKKRGRPRKNPVVQEVKLHAAKQKTHAAKQPAPVQKVTKPSFTRESNYHFEPEPLKDMSGEGSYTFFLNQSMIKRLYGEMYKSQHEPLYMAANGDLFDQLLVLAMNYAGYRDTDPAAGRLLMQELRGYILKKDKVTFLYTLAIWEKRIKEYQKPIQTKQLELIL